uniref:Uncharacterized protein n=1 Tax=Tetranychus urticae TaxID=32264 RepID=T1L263_TETUR
MSTIMRSSIGKQTDNRNKDDDFTQPKSKFGYSHGGWAVEEWDDDQDEEEEEEEEVDEDEEDGEEEAEEEEELIEEDEQEEEENDEEDEEDAEDAEEEEEEDNGNGNISARPSTPEPLVLVPRRNYGLNIGSNVTSSGLRYHLNRSEIRMHKMLREQEQQNVTPTQPEQYDKSRENGLPCSVADLLDRSAQVRRDSVELKHRFFEVDRPSSSHEHKPGNTRASSSSQMGGLSDQQSHHQSEMPGSSKSFLEETPTSRKPIYRPSRYPLGRSEGGLDSSTRTGKLNRSSANTVNDKHETPSWSRSKPNRLSSHARSNINPITSTSGFDNLSTTTVKPKPLKKSSDRSYYHSPNYHSNPVTGRIISPALTSVNSGPLAASSASASTAASNALSSSSHNYDLSNSRLSRSKSSHLLGGW